MKQNKEFRYDTSGCWYKGNTHIHSIASDGGKSLPQLAELYAGGGYDFIFLTDHWVSSDVSSYKGESPLLLIDGIELDGKDSRGSYYHVVCLGKTRGIRKIAGFKTGIEKAREQGAFLILAHPFWCGNTLEDATVGGFDGVEVYNHVCHWLNGKSNGHIHWDAMLQKNPETLCIAADDAHLKKEHPGWNGGWIAVNTESLSTEAVLEAIRAGNYYSSCGPEIRSLEYDGLSLKLKCSPSRFIRLKGPDMLGLRAGSFEGELLEEWSVKVPKNWDYMYIEIEDDQGKMAWTNTLFRNRVKAE